MMSISTSRKVPTVIRPMRPLRGLRGLSEEVFLDILRAAEGLKGEVDELLKGAGLSGTQYNALRILRGAGTCGCTCQEVIERMITRDPDVTRLLDRLEDRGLVTRARDKQDRRVVRAYLTEGGLQLVEELDDPMAELHLKQLGHIGKERLQLLAEALKTLRPEADAQNDCEGKAI